MFYELVRTNSKFPAARRLGATAAIGAGAVTMRVLLNVDIILLGVFATPEVVGDYAAAAKVVAVLLVAVEVIWNALLPRLSRAWAQDRAAFRRRYNGYLGLVILGCRAAGGRRLLLGGGLMDLLYGGRAPGAGAICRVLSLSYAVLAVGQFFLHGLIASDRQRASVPPVAVGAVVAVVGVGLLARGRGGFGASLGMLASHVALLALSGRAARDLSLADPATTAGRESRRGGRPGGGRRPRARPPVRLPLAAGRGGLCGGRRPAGRDLAAPEPALRSDLRRRPGSLTFGILMSTSTGKEDPDRAQKGRPCGD